MDLTYNDQNPGIQPTPEEIIWANGNDSTMASPMTLLGVMLRIDYQRVPKHDIAPAQKQIKVSVPESWVVMGPPKISIQC
jgi:hypothetical protein